MSLDRLDDLVRASVAEPEITQDRIDVLAQRTVQCLDDDAMPFAVFAPVTSLKEALIRLFAPVAVAAALGAFAGVMYQAQQPQTVSLASLLNTSIMTTAGY